MPIEKVNIAKPLINIQKVSFKGEESEQTITQNQNKTKNIVTALSVLGAIGAAGIAIYEHKNSKELAEKAKKEAEKKIAEAEEKAKKAAEDIEKRIKEAVDKAKEELTGKKEKPETKTTNVENDKKNKKSGRKNSGSGNSNTQRHIQETSSTQQTTQTTSTPHITQTTSTQGQNKPSSTVSSDVNGLNEEPKQPLLIKIKIIIKNIFKPKKSNAGTKTNKPIKPEISETNTKPSLWERLTNFFSKKSEPTTASEATNTKPSLWERLKNFFSRKSEPATGSEATNPKPSLWERLTNFFSKKSEPATGSEATNTKPSLWKRLKNFFSKKSEPATASEATNTKPSLWERLKNFFSKKSEPATGSEATNTKPSLWERLKNFFSRKSEPTTGSEATNTKPSLWERIKNIFKRNSEVKTGTKNDTQEAAKPEVKVSKPSAETKDEGTEKILEGGIKDTDLTEIDKTYLAYLKEGENGIIFIPRTTKISEFIRKTSDYLSDKFKGLKNIFKRKTEPVTIEKPVQAEKPNAEKIKEQANILKDVTDMSDSELMKEYNLLREQVNNLAVMDSKSLRFLEIEGELFNHRGYRFNDGVLVKPKIKTPWQKEIEEDQRRYQVLVEKVKAANKRVEESKKLVAEYEKQLNGDITVNVPKKPTNFEHKQLQKEYDKLAIMPQKSIHKSLLELKEQIAGFWKKQSENKVKELEKELNGNITVNFPKKPTNFEHKQLQKEYDKLAIMPPKRSHKSLLELKEQLSGFWKKQSDNKVKELEKELNGNITVNVPKQPTNYEHKQLQKEYDKLAINPPKAEQRKIEEHQVLDEDVKGVNKKIEEKNKKYELEKQLNGNITVNVPKKPTNFEHKQLQKEYDKLAIMPPKRIHKSLLELKEQIAGFWKKQSDNKVKILEKELNGNITVNVPKKPTNFEHKQLQKEYDKLAIEIEPKLSEQRGKQRILEGGIKDSELTEVDKTYLAYQKEGENDIIFIPRTTKVSDFVQKVSDNISNKFKSLKNFFKKPEEPILAEKQLEKPNVDKYYDDGLKEGLEYIEKEEKESAQKKLESDIRNNYWLNQQYEAKEKEYNEIFAQMDQNNQKNVLKDNNISIISENANKQDNKTKESKKNVAELEKQLNGNITVNVPKQPTNYEHKQLQKEYDKLAIMPQKRIHKSLLELKEQLSGFWKKQSDNKVKELEKELNGNITVNVPKQPTNYEHKQLQKEYDKLAIMPQKRIHKSLSELKEQLSGFWKKQSDNKVKELEKELNGNITVNVPKKPTNYEHKQLQKEYDNLSIEQKSDVATNQPIENRNAVIEQGKKPKGLNELPESFNRGERVMIKYVYKHTDAPKEKVTEYPKLYATKNDRKNATKTIFTYMTKYMWKDMFELSQAPSGNFWNDMRTPGISPIIRFKEYFKLLKEEKNAKKAYKKAKKEHIERRVNTYKKHVGMNDTETAITNSYMIEESHKFHSKRYRSMAKERPNPQDWEPEMTREEFMKDKYKYVQEAYEKECKY